MADLSHCKRGDRFVAPLARAIFSSSSTAVGASDSFTTSSPSRRAAPAKCGSSIRRTIASRKAAVSKGGWGAMPAPRVVTRMAFSDWSRPCGKISMGRWCRRARITVPWPPWVMTSFASGITASWGALETSTVFSAGLSSAAVRSPNVTSKRRGSDAVASMIP